MRKNLGFLVKRKPFFLTKTNFDLSIQNMSNITEPTVLVSTIFVVAICIGTAYAYFVLKDKLG